MLVERRIQTNIASPRSTTRFVYTYKDEKLIEQTKLGLR